MQRVHRTLFVDEDDYLDVEENHNDDDDGIIGVHSTLFVDRDGDGYHDVEEVDKDDDDDDGHTGVRRTLFADKDGYHHDDN